MCELTGQLTWSDLAGWYGKMFPEPSAPTEAKISAPSSKKRHGSAIRTPLFLDLRGSGLRLEPSWETDGASLGEYMTHSFGESPSVVRESRLSQILEEQAHPKYSLSARACQGILNRAERRGKELPEELKKALTEQAGSREDKEPTQGASDTEMSNPPHLGGVASGSNQIPDVMAYGFSSFDSNAMKSRNPHSGIYEADTSRTLDLNGGNPACNQGGVAVMACDFRNSREQEVNGTLQAKPGGA